MPLPEALVQFWRPVLRLCYQQRITPILLQNLLGQVTSHGSLRDRILLGWVATYMESLSYNGTTHTHTHLLCCVTKSVYTITVEHYYNHIYVFVCR